jgi:protein-S-isoprenylcysteine O-methyltransferase Ste14
MASKKKDKAKEAEAAVADGAPQAITLRAYPAAMASIRRVRARAALTAFALVLLLSLHSGVQLPEATARGLAAGVAIHLASWKLAVLAWRQIVLGQVREVEERRRERARERAEAQAKAAEAIAAAQAAQAA